MYYGSGTVHSPGGNTFLCEMTSWPPSWKWDVKSKIRLRQSMCIYLKKNPAEFHPDPIRNDGALGFFSNSVAPTRTRRRTRWVVIWDQFLVQKLAILVTKFQYVSCVDFQHGKYILYAATPSCKKCKGTPRRYSPFSGNIFSQVLSLQKKDKKNLRLHISFAEFCLVTSTWIPTRSIWRGKESTDI